MYDPYAFTMFLRRSAPGFSRLGAPRKLRDPSDLDSMRKGKFGITKTKDEIIEEHSLVMQKVYQRIFIAVAAAVVAGYAFFVVLETGSETYLMVAMAMVAWAMYKWWHSAAAYSNYQQFEFRPIMVPIEDLREPSLNPAWLSGNEPTFKVGPDDGKNANLPMPKD